MLCHNVGVCCPQPLCMMNRDTTASCHHAVVYRQPRVAQLHKPRSNSGWYDIRPRFMTQGSNPLSEQTRTCICTVANPGGRQA